jgi:tetratricopeptide (TPR) repeat protein
MPKSPTRSASTPTAELAALLQRGFSALTAGYLEDAAACCRQALTRAPRLPQAHFLVGLVAIERRDWRTAVQAFGSVTALEPAHAAAWAQSARAWLQLGQLERAHAALASALEHGSRDPVVADLVGSVHSQLGDQAAALQSFERAAAGRPGHAPYEINRANALVYLGRLREAETVLERTLSAEPANPQAHWQLANVRRAPNRAHVDQLEALIARAPGPQAVAFLAYAAGKEYEDLGDWPAAFRKFAQGAAARRGLIDFDEPAEVALFDALRETYTPEWRGDRGAGHPDPAPIFVVGQPRTGTTLVERVITSHSAVHSAGELHQFRLAVRRLSGVQSNARLSAEIVRAAASIDPHALGERYLETSARLRGDKPRFVDKMPTNFLLVPLIAMALPNARIVHVTRDPMDSCFASFKQLFADAYLHSYDLREMARHHARYRHLMSAWRTRFPDRLIEVSYEAAAGDLEPVARKLIAALDLPWEDACLDFHRQPAAVTTASAVQVREPAHTRSVGRWRRYEAELAPLREELRRAGIDVT